MYEKINMKYAVDLYKLAAISGYVHAQIRLEEIKSANFIGDDGAKFIQECFEKNKSNK